MRQDRYHLGVLGAGMIVQARRVPEPGDPAPRLAGGRLVNGVGATADD